MLLGNYEAKFDRGRSRFIEALWLILDTFLVRSALPGSAHRRFILSRFGTVIGSGVRFKPRLQIKFPWRLKIGDHSWLGEGVWIDNLAPVEIGANCCLSQGAYVCTGSHDWGTRDFDLIVRPVKIQDGAWIAAQSIIGPGVTVGAGAVLTLGSVATSDMEAGGIYSGVPAQLTKMRSATDRRSAPP